MDRDTVHRVTKRLAVDYAHLPGEEHNPLMESTEHVQWTVMLINAVTHTLAGSGDLVTGNVPFLPPDGGPHTAPDLMVIPGLAGRRFGRYVPGVDGPVPSVCVEVISPSNRRAQIRRHTARLLALGVPEIYIFDPRAETVVQVVAGDDGPVEVDAEGAYSPGMRLVFTRVDGSLALCCPGDRLVRPGDDPFGWLIEERARADAEMARADAEMARANAEMARANAETARANAAAAQVAALARELAELRARRSPDSGDADRDHHDEER